MSALLDEEAAAWLQDRGYQCHNEDRPTKDFYKSLEASDAERRIPVEAVDYQGRRLKSPKALCESARDFFQERFRIPPPPDEAAVDDARTACLAALDAGGYAVPAHAAAALQLDSVLAPAHIIDAIRSLPKHKMPGDDGFPSDSTLHLVKVNTKY